MNLRAAALRALEQDVDRNEGLLLQPCMTPCRSLYRPPDLDWGVAKW
ncbi:hypothetical protein H2509_18465 [Stappia sp. F7233]|uniref:Uncharacterized protein n=1 Tax=Stappia albiluteola TaxID=2758565 RepID=A0A839AK13_9HYPH|nr:hypothetical protein [Stappia albiluteola]MBA5779117.1 hypothetical protein [Stappia albiluteola]